MNKIGKVFLYIAIILLGISIVSILASVIFKFIGNMSMVDVCLTIGSLSGTVALIFLIARLYMLSNMVRNNVLNNSEPKQRPIKTVDIKEIPKTREEKLYDQYVDLFNQGLISKEDLDKKKKELIG